MLLQLNMKQDSTILVLGATGLVGSNLYSKLKLLGYTRIIPITRNECDLESQIEVDKCFFHHKPEYVFMCAGKVGGILANKNYSADFGLVNGLISLNVIYNCAQYKVKKLLYLGSSCIYPKDCPQPIKEEYLMCSYLEPTNEMYALAKIFGLKLCQAYNNQYDTNFISCMPCNLYGPNDNFNLENSHVLPALIRKIHHAKVTNTELTLFGSGGVYREFLYIDDLTDACIFLMNTYNENRTINIGTGEEILIKDLAKLICKIIGYDKDIQWDTTKPDGTYRKLLDVSKINNLGWRSNITLENGLKRTYEWYLNNINKVKI